MYAGEALKSNQKKNRGSTVLLLGFQEAKQDARVMKQARALVEAGYEVHLFCDWLKGYPRTENVDGVVVHRFGCFDPSEASPEILETLDFFCEALPYVHEKYGPFIKSCESRRWVVENFGLGFFKSFYKQARGFTRIKRKTQYIFNRRLWRFLALFETDLKELKLKLADADAGRGMVMEMDQCRAILYSDNLLRQRIECKPDIIHAHDIYTLVAGVALARKFGAKLIYDAHEYEPCRFVRDHDDRRAKLPMALENDCFPYVSAIITVSASIARLYSERYKSREPVLVLNAPENISPADTSTALRDAPSARLTAGLSEETPAVVYTGLVQAETRGLDKVIKALSSLPQYNLIVLGPRVYAEDKWLKAVAEAEGVSDRLHLLSGVDARHVSTFIRGCNAAVLPIQDMTLSLRMSMPNKILEAAFAGIPICASNLPEMRRFVESLGIGRVMDQADPQSIAEAIMDVCENPERYAPSKESRRRLQQEYSWSAQKKKLLVLYGEILYLGD